MGSNADPFPRYLLKLRGLVHSIVYNFLAWLTWQIQAQNRKGPHDFACWEGTYGNVIILYAAVYTCWVWLLKSKGKSGRYFYLHIEEVIKTTYFNNRPECLKLLNDVRSYFYFGICQTALLFVMFVMFVMLLEIRLNYCLLVEFNWESMTQLKCHLLYAAFSDCLCQKNLLPFWENSIFELKLQLHRYKN